MDEKNVTLFEGHGVMSRREMEAVAEILLENYCKQVKIDASVMSEMIRRDVLPAVISYSRELAETIDVKTRVSVLRRSIPCGAESALLEEISDLSDTLYRRRIDLDRAVEETGKIPALDRRALAYREKVMAAMARLRETADALEDLVAKSHWPYPSYGNLLYRV